MKKPAMLATVIVASLLVSLATTSSGAPAQKAAKVDLFAVVQIGEEIKVVRKSELTSLPKTVAEEDKKRQKAYEDSKKGKGAGKDVDQYQMPKPVKRSVRILKNSLKTEQDAREWKEKFLEEREGTKTSKKTDAW